MKEVSFFVLILILVTSCRYVEPEITPVADPETLEYYFEKFETEAAVRGIIIDLEEYDLEARIDEIELPNVAGTCHYSSQYPNRVTIDMDFWNTSSILSREMVVFHELGHCVLYRSHREDAWSNGRCVSIMQSGLGSCRLLYNLENRTGYLDELFFPNNF
ncbi:MAG: hypothetical protein R3275_00260 [Saprospiraceae bacterium]|nr:hypothetical protein [Saprospiraceae bacterium]